MANFEKAREVYSQVFGESLPNIVASKIEYYNVHRSKDKIGDQFEHASTAARSKVTGVEILPLGKSKPRMFVGEEISGLAEKMKAGKRGAIHLAWDAENFKAIYNKASFGGLAKEAPNVISARNILNRQFHDVAAGLSSTSSKAVGAAIDEAIASGRTGGGMAHLVKARRLLFDGVETLTDTQVSQTVLLGGAMRAVDKGEKHIFGLDFFKRLLSGSGVPGLSADSTNIFGDTDKYSIGDALSSNAKRAVTQGSDMYGAIEQTAGSRYLSELKKHIESLDPNVARSLDIRMDKNSALYIGVGSNLDSYRPLPTGYIDDVGSIGAARKGAASGMVRVGGKLSWARPIHDTVDQKLRSFVEVGLGEFFGGMTNVSEGRAGITMDNLGMAIHAGYKSFKKSKQGGVLKGLSNTPLSLGQVSLLPALYAQGTATVPQGHNVLKGTEKALVDMLVNTTNHKLDHGGFLDAIGQDLSNIPGAYPGLDFEMSGMTAIKHELSIGNVLPRAALARHFIPGVLSDPKILSKGTYQTFNTREIVGRERFKRISRSNVGLKGRIISVGATMGEMEVSSALQKAYITQGGASSHALAAVMYVNPKDPGSVAQSRRMYGDAQFYLTSLGQSGIGYDNAAVNSVEAFMTKEDTINYLYKIRGEGAEWDEYIRAIEEGKVREGFYRPNQPLPLGRNIDRRAFTGRPGSGIAPSPVATHFTGVNLSGYNSKKNFSFGRIGERAHGSFIIGANTRMTAAADRARPAGHQLEEAVHLISSMESLNAQNAWHTQFHHKLNLLTTERAPAGPEEFIKLYKEKGGTGLEYKSGRIIAKESLTSEGFNKYADIALKELGFDDQNFKGSIRGDAHGVLKLMGKDSAALVAKPGSLVMLQNMAERTGVGEDVRGALSQRLETLRLIAAGSGSEDPMAKILLSGYQSQTGITLDPLNRSSAKFIKHVPERIRNPFMPVFSKGFAPKAGEKKTISQFKQLYAGEINDLMLKGDGLSFDALESTKFFRKGRKGFYLDLGGTVETIVEYSKGSDNNLVAQNTRFMWIDSGEELMKRIDGVGGDRVAFGEDDFNKKLLRMLTAASGDDYAGLKDAARQAIDQQMTIGKKEGYFDKMMAFRAPVSAKGRLISKMEDFTSAASPIVGKGGIAAEMYDVSINKQMLIEMFTDDKGVLNYDEYEAAFKKLTGKKDNFIYGMLQPTPQHGGGHIPVVKIRYDKGLDKGADVAMKVSDFLASFIERDFDKDIAALMAIFGKRTMKYSRDALGKSTDKEVNAVLDAHFENQLKKAHIAYARAYQEARADYNAFAKVTGISASAGDKEFIGSMGKFLSFGNMPPVAWSPFYSQLEFSQAIAGTGGDADVADELNKLAMGKKSFRGPAISEADVASFRGVMQTRGMGFRQTINEAVLMQHNVAQAALTKGGELIPEFEVWHKELGAIQDLSKAGNMTVQEAVESATTASTRLGLAIADKGDISKLKGYTELFMNADRAAAGAIFGDLLGVFAGAHAFAKGKFLKEGYRFDPGIRKALSHSEDGIGGWHTADQIGVPNLIEREELFKKAKVIENSQDALAAVNEAEKAPGPSSVPGSSALDDAAGFLTKNFKAIAMIGGGLIAARTVYGALTPGPEPPPLPISNMGAAPLPAEPMVNRQPAGPSIPMQAPVARTRQMSGMTSSRNNSSRVESFSSTGPASSFNMGAIGSSWNRTTVRDDRSYTSGWEHQRLADANGRSDFVHKYMDL